VQSAQQMTADDVQAVVDKLNEFMHNGQRNLSFSVDKDTEDMVVKVMDTQTNEVIRQFPSEETLKLAKHLEGMLGLIFNDKA
jgi:flagellar protein FlaG